jgi:hypothetical protein
MKQLALLADENERLKKSANEMIRLRGEVTRLRQQTNDLATLRVENYQLRNRAQPVQGLASAQVQIDQDLAAQCRRNLRQINGAMQLCAVENRLTTNSVFTSEQILPYFRDQRIPNCPSDGTYTFGSLTNDPTCSILGHTFR